MVSLGVVKGSPEPVGVEFTAPEYPAAWEGDGALAESEGSCEPGELVGDVAAEVTLIEFKASISPCSGDPYDACEEPFSAGKKVEIGLGIDSLPVSGIFSARENPPIDTTTSIAIRQIRLFLVNLVPLLMVINRTWISITKKQWMEQEVGDFFRILTREHGRNERAPDFVV